MNKKSQVRISPVFLIFLIFVGIVIILLSLILAKTELFYEDFEAGNFNSWTLSGDSFTIATDRAIGTNSAKCRGPNDCIMDLANPIDTSNATEINVTLQFNDDDLDANDVQISFNDSSGTWQVISTIDSASEDTWLNLSVSVTNLTYFHSRFNIRFTTTLGGGPGAENLWLDNINISYRQYGWLNVSIEFPTDGSNFSQYNTNLTINATVTCEGETGTTCGLVYALARYNVSSSSPDTGVNTTKGELPFYSFGSVEEVNHSYFDISDFGPTDPEGVWTNDANAFDGDITTAATSTSSGNPTLNELQGDGTNASDVGGVISLVEGRFYGGATCGFTAVQVRIFTDGLGEQLYLDSTFQDIPAWSDWASLSTPSGGWTWAKVQALETVINQDGGGDSDIRKIEVRVTSTQKGNPQISLETIEQGESYQFNWTLNVTTGSEESYLIDVFFNSSHGNSLVADNNTANRQVNLNPSVVDTAPKWQDNSTNSTVVGTLIQHIINWTDDTALDGFIFSFDNGTGTFVNDSFVAMIGTQNWSNVTKGVNTTVGATIRWQVWANDSSDNTNITDIFIYTTTEPLFLNVSIQIPTDNTNVNQNTTFTINATVICSGGKPGDTCGNIIALARYNLSSTIPDTRINTTQGDTPMYILTGESTLNLDLAAYYDFEQSAGTVLRDNSGNSSRDGTLINMNDSSWVDGKIGNSLTFNGSSQYVNMSGYNLPSMGCAINCTISVWVEINTSVTSKHIMGDFGPAGSQNGFAMRTENGDDLITFVYLSNSNDRLTLLNVFTLDRFYHIVFAKNSTHYSIYINGTLKGTRTTNDIGDAGESFKIGTRGDLADFWESRIDELVIWTRQLNSSEILELYNNYSGITYPFKFQNPRSLGNLSQGANFTVSWIINATGNVGDSFLIDVLFNSTTEPSVVANDTENRQINIVSAVDSCTYSAGNWVIDCSDNCNITSNVDVGGNDIYITGTGTFVTEANITGYSLLHIAGTDAVNMCTVTCLYGGCFGP